MRVLVVYAHPNPGSFTHALCERVTEGLREAGHEVTEDDLYAIGFDPVFTTRDSVQFAHPTVPDALLDEMDPRQAVLDMAGGPIRRLVARRWLRGRSTREIVEEIGRHTPGDVRDQQALVAAAEGLVFVAPVFWMGLPAILKGWFERVFSYGFAYTLTPEGWKGHLDGRVPLLTQRRALVLTPTFFTEEEYDRGWRDAMDAIVCGWGLRMAGVADARHVLFYAVQAVGREGRGRYLDEARRLGREFAG